MVEVDGRIAGYGLARRPGSFAVVAPEFEGRGIGTRLIAWAEQRERERGRDRHRQWVPASNARGKQLLQSAGYSHIRSYWRMFCELDGTEQPGDPPPDGIRLRALRTRADGVAVHALDDAAFSAAADYNPSSFEEFRDEHLSASDLDPELSLVAEAGGGEMVGFLLALRWRERPVGFVDVLAVHPTRQGRGLGSALLRHAFASFGAAGLREAQLGVASDNPGARRLYERVGMRPRFQFDVYERPRDRDASAGSA